MGNYRWFICAGILYRYSAEDATVLGEYYDPDCEAFVDASTTLNDELIFDIGDSKEITVEEAEKIFPEAFEQESNQ